MLECAVFPTWAPSDQSLAMPDAAAARCSHNSQASHCSKLTVFLKEIQNFSDCAWKICSVKYNLKIWKVTVVAQNLEEATLKS